MSNNYIEKNKGLNSLQIRLIAVVCMILSFVTKPKLGLTNNELVSECLVWFSVTLFAFLLSEGVFNTTNRWKYILRVVIFTVISEPIYDYYNYHSFWNLKKQSFMCTILISLILMLLCDYINRRFKNSIINIALILCGSTGAIFVANKLNFDFAMFGILLCMMFYTSYNVTYFRLFELAVMFYYIFGLSTDTVINITINRITYSAPISIFALFSLLVTWLYNEKRGPNSLRLKIVYYLIYPLTICIFILIDLILV